MKRLCIITALPAETRPLLDALSLQQSNARHLRVYASERFLLLECGPGKMNAAAGTGAMLQAYPDIAAILNVGIAGGCQPIGQSVLAHQVRDHASGARWYPHLPDNNTFRSLPSQNITTIDAPDTHYRQGELFDMEAAGIFTAASRHLSTSQIHCIKVVSDNPEHGIETINKRTVIALIENAMPDINSILDVLHHNFNEEHNAVSVEGDVLISNLLQQIHHTVNDERILRKLIHQHIVKAGEIPRLDTQGKSSAHIRKTLQSSIAAHPVIYE